MPALTANSVTLDEILEVRAGPLKEEELWAILSHSSEALQDVLIKGKARRKGLLTYTITPESLLLCHNGKVKFSLHTVSSRNRSFTAPEMYSKHSKPLGSEATLEKICIYSLGMTLYHAAEYEIPVGKPVNLSESLEGVLLSMCEESSQLRVPLLKVLEVCHAHRKRRRFGDLIASMVTAVLGDDVPDNDSDDHSLDEETVQISPSEFMNGAEVSLIPSPDLASPRSLPSPPPSRISTKAQPTSQELVGSNDRLSGSANELDLSPRQSKQIPHILDKYKDRLDRSRRDRNQSSLPSNSSDGLISIHQSETSPHNQSESSEPIRNGTREHRRPRSSAAFQNETSKNPLPLSGTSSMGRYGQSSLQDHTPEAGYFEGPAEGLASERHPRPDLVSSSRVSALRRYDSDASITDSSSMVSGPQSSMLSDGRSSMVSITQGSYVPDSYLTDGYESEPYLTSIGSSASRAAFRLGKDSPKSSDHPYSSTMDLRKQVLTQKSFPEIDTVDYGHHPPQRFLSVPDIRVGSGASKSAKPISGSKTKLGDFFGPEFVKVAEDPNLSVVNISPRKAGSIPHGRRLVSVIVLNGQNLQIMIEANATTQVLFDQVIKYLGLTEKFFFGLTQLQDEEHIFLDLDVKLAKYAPPKWKEEVKLPTAPTEHFLLYFKVKFYVENIALLSYQKTVHQFYLQLRQDILNDQLYCHEEASFVLGGLALQAETGDYNEALGDKYFLPEHYIPSKIVDKVSVDHALTQLPHFHKDFHGLTDEQAELEFIKEAQKLQEYGVHFYKVQKKLEALGKSRKKGLEAVWIGICIRGVTVYETRGHLKFPTHRHSWPMTKKLSFKKKKFFIEPRGNPELPKMTFYTNHYKKARYLLQMSQAFHRFQMKMKTKMAILDQEMSLDETEPRVENGFVEPAAYQRSPYRRSGSEPSVQPMISRSHPQASQSRRQSSFENKRVPSDVLQSLSTDYQSNARRRYSASSESDSSSVYQTSNGPSPRKLSDTSPRQLSQDVDEERDVDVPYVIDSTLNSQKVEQVRSRDLQDEDESKRSDVFASPDRVICVIKFTKEPGKRLGITVLGGENSKRLDLGIYVKSVTEGGAAWKDGRLKAGDRILAVNGQSLERVTHERAVNILKNVTSPVELRVSQSAYNLSSFDLSSIPNASSANEEPESLEIKPLTPREPSSAAEPDSPQDSPRETPSELRPSTFAFPSEDEPVTMISKSIPPSAVSASNRPSRMSKLERDSDDPIKVSQDSRDTGGRKAQSRSQSVPLEANIIQSSLLSAAAPLVSTGVASPVEELPRSAQDSQSGEESGAYSEDVFPDGAFVVDLEKKEGSLGLSVSGGINTSVKLGGIYIKSLQPNGPADLDGRVHVGDRILAVNGISLIGVTHKQAVETIKMAPHRTRLVLDRSVPVNVPKSTGKKTRPQASDKPFTVELLKGVGGLGLSLVGGKGAGEEHGGFLRIKKMFPGQPAASCGKLQIGDIMLEVNGNSMQGVTHQEAINLIRTGPTEVKLLVKREPSSIPQSLLQRSGSNASDVDPAQILADIQNKLKADSPSLSKRSSESSARGQLSNASSLEVRDEVPITQEAAVINEAPVSLRSSLISEESAKQIAQSSHPNLASRLSEPVVIQARKEHETLAATNSLPNITSVRPKDIPKVNRQEAFQHSTEEEDADATSLGDAPLAEDESSDVEDSRRSSSIDIVPPDCSIYDEQSVRELMEKLSTVESSEDETDLKDTGKMSLASNKPILPVLQDEVSSPSSESEESDVEKEPIMNNTDQMSILVTDIKEDVKPRSLTPQEELLYIELTKGSGGLGFTLAGGANTVGGCFVRDIVGGPAEEDGRLQAGDQILAVDGEDISSMKHMDAVNVLRATKQTVKLKVLRRPAGYVGSTQSGTVEVVNLTRTSQGRIGLLIKEGDDHKIYVEDVVPGEPAATQGDLRQGDRILEINSTKVDGLGFVAARQHLDAARPVARLLVERRPRLAESKYAMSKANSTDSKAPNKSWSVDSPGTNTAGSSDENDSVFLKDKDEDGMKENENDDEDSQGEHFNVTLCKGPRGFGFSLVAAPTFSSDAHGIFIKTISPGSVAESDGRLKVGDQILKVNKEDVQGLSHAKVIGMLRKITGTVELEINRPSKLYMSDSVNTPPLSPLGSSATQSNVPATRAPLERSPNSVDLDITLEDKDKTLTGSTDIQDEDDVTELLNAISAANNTPVPPTDNIKSKPKLNKRDTDMVLSSLLESLQPPPSPPESLRSVDPREFDSQWESGYSDNEAPRDLVSSKSRQSLEKKTSSSANSTIAENERNDSQQTFNSLAVQHSITRQLDSASDNDITTDNDVNDSSNDGDDDDIDMDDEDVFDMLRDNSQLVISMLNNDKPESTVEVNNNVGHKDSSSTHNTLEVDAHPDVPPPIPTTPLPSDDDEPPVKPPPRRESLPKFSGNSSAEESYSLPVVNESVNGHSSGDELTAPSEPLIDVLEGGQYSGDNLAELIRSVKEKILSNIPAEEFRALREIKQTDGCDSGKKPANKDKNRYRNVLPFEKTRVQLSGDGDGDYINASHVKIPVGDDVYHYIATQGPLPNTIQDFWQMIWEQEVVVIAMVTLQQEGGKVKCHRYWPNTEDQPVVYTERIAVSLLRQEDFGSFIERELELHDSQTGKTRTVSHINFITWPDHGVPKSAVELVEFVRFLRLLAEGPGPVVVHCSAGIGRTGALITIDVAIGLMERDLPFDVNKIVRKLREQRQGMIQTKDQYIFCYKACLEVLMSLTAS